MLLTKTVVVKWNSKNKKWHEEKGYIFTKWKDEFEVKVEDLSKGCRVFVKIECDGCKEIIAGVRWEDYLKQVKEDGTYYCKKCAMNGHKKWISFYEWCYINLSKEEADYILSRWDYDKNIDKYGNKLMSKDVSYASQGLNKEGYWFKCLRHPEHGSELKKISGFTNQSGSINCNKCKVVASTHPHLITFFINEEDAYKYSYGSHDETMFKCPHCNFHKKMKIKNFIRDGLSCPKCGDGVSYPNKFIFNLFEQLLDKNFQIELSKSIYKWSKDYRYDFYIDKLNGIIVEAMGIQHYEEVKGWYSLEETQNNDFDKEWLARSNGINNYIILDCRKSHIEWIKNSIMNSKLPQLLNFKEEDIDWLKCHEMGNKNLVKVVCELWSSGIRSTTIITEQLKIGKNTTVRYLKQGVELGWCDYDPKEVLSHKEYNYRKVICLTTNEIFESVLEASIKYNVSSSSISACCNNRQKYACRHLVTNEKLLWMGYEEYLINNQTIGWYDKYIDDNKDRLIVKIHK